MQLFGRPRTVPEYLYQQHDERVENFDADHYETLCQKEPDYGVPIYGELEDIEYSFKLENDYDWQQHAPAWLHCEL